VAEQNLKLKQFLRKNLYHHYKVNRMSAKAARIVRELFKAFYENIGLLPDEFQVYAETDKARAVADYIAGMTDRFAIREHRKLFTVEEYL
jgi:dGTPase